MASNKSQRARPKVNKHGSLRLFIRLTLVPGRDDDLIAELNDTPLGHLASRVREMMRNGISSGRFMAEEKEQGLDVNMGDVGVEL